MRFMYVVCDKFSRFLISNYIVSFVKVNDTFLEKPLKLMFLYVTVSMLKPIAEKKKKVRTEQSFYIDWVVKVVEVGFVVFIMFGLCHRLLNTWNSAHCFSISKAIKNSGFSSRIQTKDQDANFFVAWKQRGQIRQQIACINQPRVDIFGLIVTENSRQSYPFSRAWSVLKPVCWE